jgi:hypothetical protein
VFSQEKDYDRSHGFLFAVYSGSMAGKVTELIVRSSNDLQWLSISCGAGGVNVFFC